MCRADENVFVTQSCSQQYKFCASVFRENRHFAGKFRFDEVSFLKRILKQLSTLQNLKLIRRNIYQTELTPILFCSTFALAQ